MSPDMREPTMWRTMRKEWMTVISIVAAAVSAISSALVHDWFAALWALIALAWASLYMLQAHAGDWKDALLDTYRTIVASYEADENTP